MQSNTKYIIAIPTATAAILFYAYISAANLPERNIDTIKKGDSAMATLGKRTAIGVTWENVGNPYFPIDSQRINNQINVIHDFVSLVLQESQDLNPRYAKVVDKYFWDLV